ncbi:hypothetical protein LCGC14_0517110 [marine sediment metagenome]|uniref:Uncharacterized protein n=1 Tax=marine sediment metagenome TaxID=412755 RepID=A0A0F9SI32_9ZZZZ
MTDKSHKDCPVCLVSHTKFNAVTHCLYRLSYIHFNFLPDISSCGCPHFCRKKHLLEYVRVNFPDRIERANDLLSI